MFSKLCTLLLLSILALGAVPVVVIQAQPVDLAVDVENEEYSPGADVTVNGIGSPNAEVVLQVFNPRESMVDIDIVRCGGDGAYNKTFRTPYNQTGAWMAGNYTVRAYLGGSYAADSFILSTSSGGAQQNATGAPPPSAPAGNLTTINLGSVSLGSNANATGAGNQTGANMTGVAVNLTNAGSLQAATYMNNQSLTKLANATPAPAVGLELVAEDLNAPLALIPSNDGSGRLFVIDQIGIVRIIENGSLADEPFLDLRSRIVNLSPAYDERGLLSLAFHPDYRENGKLYVFYSAPLRGGAPADWDCTNYLSEFTVNNNTNTVNMSSERILMAIDKPYTNHNGGPILFGSDGHLYILTGDGGRADDTGRGHNATIGNGQDLMTVLGKVLRIDVNQMGASNMTQTANMTATGNQTAAANQTGANMSFITFTGNSSSGTRPYGIPQDNPFVNNASALPEIYALGFRNPAFASFYSNMSDVLFVADAGQALFEEIDMVLKGGNYGWRIREGAHCFNASDHFSVPANCTSTGYNGEPLIGPIVECGHDLGIVIVGGNVYNGTNMTALRGKYFFGIFSSSAAAANGSILVATPPSGWNVSTLPTSARSLTSDQNAMWDIQVVEIADSPNGLVNHYMRGFGIDQAGELYVLTNDLLGPVSNGTTGKVYKIVAANATGAGNQTGANMTQTSNMTGTANMTGAGNQTGAAANMTAANVTAINYVLNVTGLSNITGAHIHMGAPGENGPIVVGFYPANTSSPLGPPINVSGVLSQGTITAANLTGPLNGSSLASLISLFQNGSAYVNVHTSRYPGGEIRGQIVPAGDNQTGTAANATAAATNYVANLTGTAEQPPNNSTARGLTAFNLTSANITAPRGVPSNMTGGANATTGGMITIVVTMPNGTTKTYSYNASQAANMAQYGAGAVGPLIIINIFIENSSLVFSAGGAVGPGVGNATGSQAPGQYGYGWGNMWQAGGPGWQMDAGNIVVIINVFIKDSSLQFYAGNVSGYPVTASNTSAGTNTTAP